MKAQSNNSTWTDQIEKEIFNLLYISLKGVKTSIHNRANNLNNTPLPHGVSAFNINYNIN